MGNDESVTSAKIESFPLAPGIKYKLCVEALKREDFESAIGLARELIDGNFLHASTLMGAAYEMRGDINGDRGDYETALFYYRQAVDSVGAVEAWLALARLSYFGKGTPKDYKKAADYYQTILAETSNGIAHLMLGKMYLEGEGVDTDLQRAKQHLLAAMEQRYVYAWTYLGTFYFRQGDLLRAVGHRIQASVHALVALLQRDPAQRLRRI